MSNLVKQPSELVKASLILAGAAVLITLIIVMYFAGILQKGGWVFLVFAALIAYNFWQRHS
jgi:hypothetical protein